MEKHIWEGSQLLFVLDQLRKVVGYTGRVSRHAVGQTAVAVGRLLHHVLCLGAVHDAVKVAGSGGDVGEQVGVTVYLVAVDLVSG